MTQTNAKAPWTKQGVPFDRTKLRYERTKAGLQQNELARKAGVSKAHVSRLELGRCGPSPDVLRRLAEALDCPVEDLMPAEQVS
jgi:transcriptional regulator with XRE-family HTH domain